jgi:hypothetical protein
MRWREEKQRTKILERQETRPEKGRKGLAGIAPQLNSHDAKLLHQHARRK